MDPIGDLEDVPVGGMALELEAVEQRAAAPTLHLECELPSEIVSVMQSGVQTLSTERARQVTCVAEQKTPAVEQPLDETPVHAKRRQPT